MGAEVSNGPEVLVVSDIDRCIIIPGEPPPLDWIQELYQNGNAMALTTTAGLSQAWPVHGELIVEIVGTHFEYKPEVPFVVGFNGSSELYRVDKDGNFELIREALQGISARAFRALFHVIAGQSPDPGKAQINGLSWDSSPVIYPLDARRNIWALTDDVLQIIKERSLGSNMRDASDCEIPGGWKETLASVLCMRIGDVLGMVDRILWGSDEEFAYAQKVMDFLRLVSHTNYLTGRNGFDRLNTGAITLYPGSDMSFLDYLLRYGLSASYLRHEKGFGHAFHMRPVESRSKGGNLVNWLDSNPRPTVAYVGLVDRPWRLVRSRLGQLMVFAGVDHGLCSLSQGEGYHALVRVSGDQDPNQELMIRMMIDRAQAKNEGRKPAVDGPGELASAIERYYQRQPLDHLWAGNLHIVRELEEVTEFIRDLKRNPDRP